MLLAGGAVEGAGVGRAVPAGGASGEGVAGGVGMMGMVFSASTTVLADSTVPPIVPTSMRTTAPSKGPSQAVPLLVPVSNLCAVRETWGVEFSFSIRVNPTRAEGSVEPIL